MNFTEIVQIQNANASLGGNLGKVNIIQLSNGVYDELEPLENR